MQTLSILIFISNLIFLLPLKFFVFFSLFKLHLKFNHLFHLILLCLLRLYSSLCFFDFQPLLPLMSFNIFIHQIIVFPLASRQISFQSILSSLPIFFATRLLPALVHSILFYFFSTMSSNQLHHGKLHQPSSSFNTAKRHVSNQSPPPHVHTPAPWGPLKH